MIELTKAQKKKVRELIEEGLRRDYLDGIARAKKICDKFNEQTGDPTKVYHELVSTLIAKDKQIERRYDSLTGSKYFLCLLGLVRDGTLPEEELDRLDDELRNRVLFLIKSL